MSPKVMFFLWLLLCGSISRGRRRTETWTGSLVCKITCKIVFSVYEGWKSAKMLRVSTGSTCGQERGHLDQPCCSVCARLEERQREGQEAASDLRAALDSYGQPKSSSVSTGFLCMWRCSWAVEVCAVCIPNSFCHIWTMLLISQGGKLFFSLYLKCP